MKTKRGYYEQLADQFIGQKFGRLTIQKILKKRQAGRLVAQCLCSCGKLSRHQLTSIKMGNVQSCGCLNKEGATHRKATIMSAASASKDYTGQKYNRLTFIRRSDKRDPQYPNRRYWEVVCDCGTIKTVTASYVKSGHTKSCGCLNQELRIARGTQNRKYDPIISSAKYVHRACYSDCTFEMFYSLSQQNCHYCGRCPHKSINIAKGNERHYSDHQKQNGNFIYNGLDRVDNTLGHTADNVVPCCYTCNIMKNAIPLREFLNHVQRIHSHLQLGQTY